MWNQRNKKHISSQFMLHDLFTFELEIVKVSS